MFSKIRPENLKKSQKKGRKVGTSVLFLFPWRPLHAEPKRRAAHRRQKAKGHQKGLRSARGGRKK
jgi:hypothetical protein